MNEKELAEIEKIEAETDTLFLDGGVLSTLKVRQRIAAEVDSPYSNIDVDDVPEHPDMVLAEASKTPNVFSKGRRGFGLCMRCSDGGKKTLILSYSPRCD
jgi:hypothetical protein